MIKSAADFIPEDTADIFLFGRRLHHMGTDKTDDSSSFKSRSISSFFYRKTFL
jgi:hypothetical protein